MYMIFDEFSQGTFIYSESLLFFYLIKILQMSHVFDTTVVVLLPRYM